MSRVTTAGEIQFVEDYALASDRAKALEQLIPGTEDYYYFYALHHQSLEQFDRVDQLLEAWIKRYNITPRVQEIQHRQALLRYARDPQATLDYLKQQLQLRFDHQRERVDADPQLSSALDPQLLSREALTAQALRENPNLNGFEDSALVWLIDQELDANRRRDMLGRIRLPDHVKLPELIVADLRADGSRGFGSLPIHNLLTQDQLQQCARLLPSLWNETAFIHNYIVRLQPSADVDWPNSSAEKQAYLIRLWEAVRELDPAQNSLKAHVLYHRLALDETEGRHDRALFGDYLQLPRNVPYLSPRFRALPDSRRFPADINLDVSSVTQLPPIGNDEPLVRRYLAHFLVDAADYKAYQPYIDDTYLKELFAETKIVNGLGEPERWYSLLPPEKYQALKDRVDLDFAVDNPQLFASDDPVNVDLYVKNVPSLIVKVFEVNTRNFYQQNLREVNTDIGLDGLIANQEITHNYTESPLRRVRRHFEFPALRKPGVYVLDFIGNGKNSRVVVRKGRLQYFVRSSAAGHLFTVLDENQQQVSDATLWLAGKLYEPLADGTIVVPYSTNPQRQAIVLSRGELSSLHFFQHEAEQYRLAVGFHVDRESLIRHRQAALLVRPGLYVNGRPASLADLEEIQLTIASTDLDGIESKKVVTDLAFRDDAEATHLLQVPPRLARLSFTLTAKIKSLSENKKLDLSASDSLEINGMDQTPAIEAIHLLQATDGFALELLGKSGESRANRPVQLQVKHRDFRAPVHATLKTDAQGRIALGQLSEITMLTATVPEGTRQWNLLTDRHTIPTLIQGRVGQALYLPFVPEEDKPAREQYALFELRGQSFAADRFGTIAARDGQLVIEDLQAGDYELWLKRENRNIRLQITAGEVVAGYAIGTSRRLELREKAPLQIAAVDTKDNGTIRIRLVNHDQFSRVHLFATRYYPVFDSFPKFDAVRDVTPATYASPAFRSLYMSERDIGDEYRYIIERAQAMKFPGNMLERPSLLLNPWPIRDTQTSVQQAASGVDFAPAADAAMEAEAMTEDLRRSTAVLQQDPVNLDFLRDGSLVLSNLEPNAEGIVEIPRKNVGDHQLLQIVAADPLQVAFRLAALPPVNRNFADVRLAGGLDSTKHYTQQRQVTILRAGDSFQIPDVTTARFETYDSLANVYGLFATLNDNPNLREFRFVLDWPHLETAAKIEKYSQFACHELNFFIYKKDPDFFASVVRPFIAHKLDKTFLDYWLLQADLSDYLRPWNYEQLNTVERLLLAERIDGEDRRAARYVSDRFGLIPRDMVRENWLFETAVASRALESNDAVHGAVSDLLLKDQAAMRFDAKSESLPSANGLAAGAAGYGAAAPQAAAPPSRRGGREEQDAAEKMVDKRSGLRALGRTPASGEERSKAMFFGRDRLNRGLAERLYVKLEKTQEWVENNYYRLPIEAQNSQLVTVNAFWHDFAQHRRDEPFFSPHWTEASRNFTEMMFALALLDIPFDPAEHATAFDEARLTYKAAGPLAVFHQQLREVAGLDNAETAILVSENFFRQSERYQIVQGERQDKFITDEFLVQTVYGAQVVVTNPSSSQQKVAVLVQIPTGAIPVNGSRETHTLHVDLAPYQTQSLEYYFYFPAPGDYAHFPVHVAREEQLLAAASAQRFRVVNEPSNIDRQAWDYVSQFATDDQVLEFLRNRNVHEVNLSRIAFRMGDKPFFTEVVRALEERHAFDPVLWSYAIKHNSPQEIRQYLQFQDAFVAQCGEYLQSELLTSDPVVRKTYQHLEYKPLVNARAHQLGRRRQILNDRLFEQYHRLLKVLCYRRALDDDDRMSVVYYLLLQDRVAEALALFAEVQPNNLESRLQYDYFAAYLDCFESQPATARILAAKYADYPVKQWRNAFATIRSLLDELEGQAPQLIDPENRNQSQSQLAASQPQLDLVVEARQVRVDYKNVAEVTVNYYLIDLELLFSRNPFVQRFTGQFSQIRPNETQLVPLPGDKSNVAFPLPEALLNRNLLVEIVGAGQTRTQVYYSNSLNVQVTESYGQVQVVDSEAKQPVTKAYVKVYAEMQDGTVQFYKDGYTDLRGRFDYSSLSTNELDFVQRLSLLVLSERNGGLVREVQPPKR